VEVTSGRLYVGNLNYDTTDSDLAEHFGQAGTVQSAEVVSNPHNNRSKGFGFVEMGSIEEAKSAVDQFDGKELAGRSLIVNGAKADTRSDRPARSERSSSRERSDSRERRPRREDGGGRRSGEREPRRERRDDDHTPAKRKDVEVLSSPNLEITGVNKVLTEEDLVDFFRGIGTMTSCEIVKNDAGETTGANVVMTDTAEAQRAVEIMDGKTFMGQQIKSARQKGDAAPAAETPAAESTPAAETPAVEEAAEQEPAAEEEVSEEKPSPTAE